MEEEALIERAKTRIRNRVADPESVQFRNVLARNKQVFGEYNSKNRFGGYTNWKSFDINFADTAGVGGFLNFALIAMILIIGYVVVSAR